MSIRYALVQAVLRVSTARLRVYKPGMAPITTPEEFLLFQELPTEPLLSDLVVAYQEVFSEPPWNEVWSREEVIDKLRRDLSGDSPFLVLMIKDGLVGGFSWGAILPIEKIESEIKAALQKEPTGLEALLRKGKRAQKVVYFHEFAALRRFRKGIDPLRFLLRPGLEMGYEQGVCQTLFWSTSASKIVPLTLYMGYQSVLKLKTREKEIVFLLNKDFQPILKLTQNMKADKWANLMKVTARIGTRLRAGQ